MGTQQQVMAVLPEAVRSIFMRGGIDHEKLQEIRMRSDKPLMVVVENKERFVNVYGRFVTTQQEAVCVENKWIRECLEHASQYSLYAYEEEIKQGFITIRGGHRIGVAGKIVMEGEKILQMKHISCLNIRLAQERKGCAQDVYRYVVKENGIHNTLLVSPPRCGKTTILRDLIRLVSTGTEKRTGVSVGVVDERSELGACYMGVPQNDLGPRTDILDCCPKAEGMMMLIRAMAPEVIAVDEIGGSKDLDALRYALNCGVSLLATAHGADMEGIRNRPVLSSLVERQMFTRYIVLGSKKAMGTIREIYDERGQILYSATAGASGKGGCV